MSTPDSNPRAVESPKRTHKQRLNSIAWLREELRDLVAEIQDPQLRQEIHDWLREATQLPAADLEDFLQSKINGLTGDRQPMMATEEFDDPTDAFPDACEGCEHYGGACPIAVRQSVQRSFDRIADDADSQVQYKRQTRDKASLYGCHRIPQWIEDWSDKYEGIVERGHDLYSRSDLQVSAAIDTDGPAISPEDLHPDGGDQE